MVKALIDYTDAELRTELRRTVERVPEYGAAHYREELARRSADRYATASFRLAFLVGAATIINVAVVVWDTLR